MYKLQNDRERAYYKQNPHSIKMLLNNIRTALNSNETLVIPDEDFSGFLDINNLPAVTYITLFQSGNKLIRFGSKKENLQSTLQRCINQIRNNKNFTKFEIDNPEKCRIMLEFTTKKTPVEYNQLTNFGFSEYKFEPGINGLELIYDKNSYYYMPTDAIVNSQITPKQALDTLIKRTSFGKSGKNTETRLSLLKEKLDTQECKLFLLESKAFITYNEDAVPLYRGNILYNDFDYNTVLKIFLNSANWLIDTFQDDNRFLYYYDCATDTRTDHEHPNRKDGNLYYNDLRHSGGIVTLLRAFQETGDEKYLITAKKAIDFTLSTVKKHDSKYGEALYSFYNSKAKLGGTGLALVCLMQYRILTNDTGFDEYIKGFSRHILSRVYNGELIGYYIHPAYNNGEPILEPTESERRELFSFYYPGEALLGLALVANRFSGHPDFQEFVKHESEPVLDWIINERPKYYSDLYTALPSDGWLMQAIEEWAEIPELRKEEYLDFVFSDATTMMEKMYKKDDTPYLDYEGSYYYDYGDHFYPDGARSEGLIASYYLAKKIGKEELSQRILSACKLAAKSQFQLYIDDISNYSHLNQKKSLHAIKFKATRQWVRTDSIQHVACFFIRLYWAEHKALNYNIAKTASKLK